jgi:hypothetical protein
MCLYGHYLHFFTEVVFFCLCILDIFILNDPDPLPPLHETDLQAPFLSVFINW